MIAVILMSGFEGVKAVKFNTLNPEEKRVILQKGTERPFAGEYWNTTAAGTYICRQCNTPLYRSADKFESHCGWPSFDDELPGAVRRQPDADGRRTEILCAACDAHLGHVFKGERMTAKDTRHCVNSVSMRFIPEGDPLPAPVIGRAVFAGGCFWGVEYFMQQTPGVIRVVSGYTGGRTEKPSYREVCSGSTGHAEAVEIIYDPAVTDYETLARLFFEIHDPTQVDRQGPDIGEQYRSEIFFLTEAQKQTAEKLIALLKAEGIDAVTRVTEARAFWPAETYHQDYYVTKGSKPYCHGYVKRFTDR
ncbi:bifunctional methionine sulfoxide reductase B/A protein [bacterium]|nr:bifunctional methionine sulfoxide reductase B/A protein [candidate division CSSED10-310 bacterium]